MPNFTHERRLIADGHDVIVAFDEAGRGPLAGPVVVGALIVNLNPKTLSIFDRIRDSKKMTKNQINAAYENLSDPKNGFRYAVGVASNIDIDQLGIVPAVGKAIDDALNQLSQAGINPTFALCDANCTSSSFKARGIQYAQYEDGETQSSTIAGASVLAKHDRDLMMINYGAQYPEYGFESHKGYGTKKHKESLETHGPCPIHRLTFGKVGSYTKSASVS